MTSAAAAVYQLPTACPLPATADPAFDRIAGVVARLLRTPLALVSLVDQSGQTLPGQSGLGFPLCETRFAPLDVSICQHVVRSGTTLVVADARQHPLLSTNPAVAGGQIVAYAGVPLRDLHGSTVGSLCAVDVEPRQWTDSELDLLSDLAAMCSAELQLRESAGSAVAAHQRSTVLLELSEALSQAVTIDQVTEVVSELATNSLGGVFGGIAILDEGTQMLRYVDLSPLPAAQAEYSSFPVSRYTPSAVSTREHRNLFFGSLARMAVHYPDAASVIKDSGFESACYLPLQLGDRVLGTLTMLWDRPKRFLIQERSLLTALARYTAQAVHRAALLAERHEVAHALQSQMLPTLPEVSWLELSGSYLPASTSDAVGGDWYDAFELSRRELAVSVGDVEGHDAWAAGVMGRVRSIVRGVVATPPAIPNDVLTVVDRVLSASPSGRFATGMFGVLRRDPHGDTFTWSNAGHMPPLLLTPGRMPTFLHADVDPPLAADLSSVVRRSQSITLPPSSTLLLFTDGLVERRGTDIDNALQRLTEAAGRASHLPLDEMTAAVIQEMTPDRHDDDLVLLAIRNTPQY